MHAYNTTAPEEAHAHIYQRQMFLPKANVFTKGKYIYQMQMCLPIQAISASPDETHTLICQRQLCLLL